LVSSLVFILISWIDRLVIGVARPEQDIAVYDIAAKLSILVSFNLDAINSILAPKIARFYSQGLKKRMEDTINFSVAISSIIALTIFSVLYFFDDFLLGLFGSEYIAGKYVLLYLSLGQLFNCLMGSVGTILQMTGNQKTYRRIMLEGLIVNILLNIILVGIMGIEGAAIATACSLIFWNVKGAYMVHKKLSLTSYFNLFKLMKR